MFHPSPNFIIFFSLIILDKTLSIVVTDRSGKILPISFLEIGNTIFKIVASILDVLFTIYCCKSLSSEYTLYLACFSSFIKFLLSNEISIFLAVGSDTSTNEEISLILTFSPLKISV